MKNRFGTDIRTGMHVRAHHARGGTVRGWVTHVFQESAHGWRASLGGFIVGLDDCTPCAERELTAQEEFDRMQLRARLDRFGAWLDGRNSYGAEEVPDGLEVTNADRSKLECLDFIHNRPDRYFCYVEWVEGQAIRVLTFAGETLGKVIWQGPVYLSPAFGRASQRVNIRVKMLSGDEYSGTYYKSAGDYCRLRRVKA